MAVVGTESGIVSETLWLKLHFSKLYFIDKIRVYSNYYNNWFDSSEECQRNVNVYQSCKRQFGDVQLDLLDQDQNVATTCGLLEFSVGLEREDQVYEFECGTEAEYVLLSKMGSFRINEIVVTAKTGTVKSMTYIVRHNVA